jgi:hypothetical protein
MILLIGFYADADPARRGEFLEYPKTDQIPPCNGNLIG